MLKKSLILLILLFNICVLQASEMAVLGSASARTSRLSLKYDYELMAGFDSKNFKFSATMERQDGLKYNGQQIFYNRNLKNDLDFKFDFLNDPEHKLNVVSFALTNKIFKYSNIGVSLVRKNWDVFTPALYFDCDYKNIIIIKSVYAGEYYLNSFVLRIPYKLNEKTSLVLKTTLLNTDDGNVFKTKLQLEYKL